MILVILFEATRTASSEFLLNRLSDPEAICLDGSPAAYYLSENEVTDHIYLNFQGGGWCSGTNVNQTLAECLSRSKTNLGSSKNYAQKVAYQGILSGNQQANPFFHNFTKIHIPYCTGTGHQGHISQPVPFNGTNLYFRGHKVTLAVLQALEQRYKLLSNPNVTLYLGGQSAGGLATFTWADYINGRIAGKFYAIPDSGIFNDEVHTKTKTYLYRSYMQNLVALVNIEVKPPNPDCASYYSKELWKCMMVEYLWPFIRTETFIIQSLYDTWVTANILGLSCSQSGLSKCTSEQMAILQTHRVSTLRFVGLAASKYWNSAWAIACTNHVYDMGGNFNSQNYKVEGMTLSAALGQFINRKHSNGFFDEEPWPSNDKCSMKLQQSKYI